MVTFSCLLTATVLPLVRAISITPIKSETPTVHITNGTVLGRYNAYYNQDLFLGIPFAKPPIEHLRFARPQPLAEEWTAPKQATEYGPSCYGFSVGLVGYDRNVSYPESEDCLTLNVVRPQAYDSHWSGRGLPVLVWVYGGGFQEGGSGDPRYNMSRLVEASVDMGKPVIGVSFNYRANVFGFVSGEPFVKNGSANLGIHDQRLALKWIQENIALFGGDPNKVTLQGESAGALSIALNMLAYNGRDDGLFHGAILESGSPFFAHNFLTESEQKEVLDGFLVRTNCSSARDIVSCLRAIPAASLVQAAARAPWRPVIDGDIFSQLTSESIERGDFIRIPLLIGTNTNEGSSFLNAYSGRTPVDTFDDIYRVLQADVAPFIIPNETISQCHELYSEVMKNPSEARMGTMLSNPGPAYGRLHGMLSVLLGDSMFNSGRRTTCQAWAKRGLPAYSFRFDTDPAGLSPEVFGAAHFQEVPFVFSSLEGNGYDFNPFDVDSPSLKKNYLDLARLMSRMWLSFVQTGSPNNHGVAGHNLHWPQYSVHSPVNIVFNATSGITLEADNYRVKAMNFFWEKARIYNR